MFAEQISVTWARWPFPPLFITSGADDNSGFGDIAFLELRAHLKDMKHIDFESNFLRALGEIKSGRNMCTIMTRIKARSDYVLFSKPILVVENIKAYAHVGTLNDEYLMGEHSNRSLSLYDDLPRIKGVSIGIGVGRSYGEVVNKFIRTHTDLIYSRYGSEDAKGLIRMFLARRVLLALEYPIVMNYFLDRDVGSHAIEEVSIAELPPYTYGRVGCAASGDGAEIIKQIDAVIDNSDVKNKVKAAVIKWSGERRSIYQKLYKEHLDNF